MKYESLSGGKLTLLNSLDTKILEAKLKDGEKRRVIFSLATILLSDLTQAP
jgi:hypothetical protein